jgi:hypothetical protein
LTDRARPLSNGGTSDSSSEQIPAAAGRPAEEGLVEQDPDDAFDAVDAEASRGGGKLLADLADVLRQAGPEVTEMDGWQRRERGGKGYSRAPIAIIVHHTASPPAWNGQRDADFLATGCAVAPMANLYLERSGRWWVLAGGATNTNGKGGPFGRIPANSANSRVLGIEAGNNGIGEPWPEVMQDSYTAGVARSPTTTASTPRTCSPTTSGPRRAKRTRPAPAASAP